MRVYDRELMCDDCGASDEYGTVWGFSSAITLDGQSRVYCERCRRRRGLAYLFDSRRWAEIEAAQTKASA